MRAGSTLLRPERAKLCALGAPLVWAARSFCCGGADNCRSTGRGLPHPSDPEVSLVWVDGALSDGRVGCLCRSGAGADLLLGGAGSPCGQVHCLRASGLASACWGWVSPWWYQASRKDSKWPLPVLVSSQKKEHPEWPPLVSVPRRSPSCFHLSVNRWVWRTLPAMASALGPGVCEVLCVPLKSEVSVSSSPRGLPVGCQSQIFLGAHLPAAGLLGWEAWCGVRPLNPWGGLLQLWHSFCWWVSNMEGVGHDCVASLPLLLNSFFISLAVGNLSVSLQVVLKDSCWISSWNLVCPWQEGEFRVLSTLLSW